MNAIEFISKMDDLARNMFGEFGYDTCSSCEKVRICEQLINELNK